MKTAKPVCREGLADIASQYDAFLIDQWGVIHDGRSLYPGALQALSELKKAEKQVIILTNSSKTDAVNRFRLERDFGITSDLYTEVISSAQLLLNLMTERKEAPWSNFGRNVFVVADGTDGVLVQNTDLNPVEDIKHADTVMLLSIAPGQSHLNHQDWINSAVERGLVLTCPSADLLSVSQLCGVVGGMASVANDYKQKGGQVLNVGKPESLIYQHCKQFLGNAAPDRILAIGDQIASDVVGARRHGFDAALVITGAAPQTFPQAVSLADFAKASYAACDPKTYCPNWILPSLQWRKDRGRRRSTVYLAPT